MTPVAASPTRGYTATKDQLQTWLRRIEGQVRGIQGMVDDDRYCIDVLTRISAIQAALDKVALGLLDDHVHHCVKEGAAEGRTDEMATEMMAAVGRLMRRGQSRGRTGGAMSGFWHRGFRPAGPIAGRCRRSVRATWSALVRGDGAMKTAFSDGL